MRKNKIYNVNEYIGIELTSKRIKVCFKDSHPFVVWEKEKFDLANLHVHSKRFEKFLPAVTKHMFKFFFLKFYSTNN